jgi:hypothetical protein
MAQLASAESILQYVEPTAVLVLLIRLSWQGLIRRYKYFSGYLVISLCQVVVPLVFGLHLDSDAYARFYFFTEPVLWLSYLLVLLELFDHVFKDFPGIRSAGKLAVKIAVPVAIIAAGLTALPSIFHVAGASSLLRLYLVVERSVMVVILLVLVIVQTLLFRFGLRLPKNTVSYSLGYAIFFGVLAAQGFLLSELGIQFVTLTNTITITLAVACLLFWTFTLTREGEAVQVTAGPRVSEAQRQRMREQLMSASNFMTHLRAGLKRKNTPAN